MYDRGENKPTKEAIAATEALRKGITSFLDSRGIDAKKVLSRGRAIGVKLTYDDVSEDEIPPQLTNFVREQYFGRKVGIDYIEAGFNFITIYASHLYPRTDEEIARAKQRVVIPGEETLGMPVTESVFQVEQRDGFKYVVVPENNIVLCNAICIAPERSPLETGITTFPLEEWLKREKAESPQDHLERRLSVINKVVDPHGLGFSDEKRKTIPQGDVLTRPLNPDIIFMIASMIPDLPPNRQKRISQSFFGPIESFVSEPRKEITIY